MCGRMCVNSRAGGLLSEEVQVFGGRQKGGGRGRNCKHVGLAETDSGNGGRLGAFVGPRGVGKRWGGFFTTWKGQPAPLAEHCPEYWPWAVDLLSWEG